MSGFSSLLDQFKETTQQAAASSSSAGGYDYNSGPSSQSGAPWDTKKRPRSIFEVNQLNNNNGQTAANDKTNQRKQQQQYQYPSTPVRKIYIACPAFAETGGPEALHQLCHVINTGGYGYGDDNDGDEDNSPDEYDEFGRAITGNIKVASPDNDPATTGGNKQNVVKAYMLYLRERGQHGEVEHIQSVRACSTKYDRYDAPPAQALPGMMEEELLPYTIDRGNGSKKEEKGTAAYSSELVIWPECWTHLIDSLQFTCNDDTPVKKKYQIAIWWLSVNNNKGRFLPDQFAIRRDVLHLVQSAYAREYVSSKFGKKDASGSGGLNVMNLTEFIPSASPSFALKVNEEDVSQESETNDRDLDVVYNPAKGMHYTDEIIRRACGKKARMNADGSVCGGGIRFSPIGKGVDGRERMTGDEVVALLGRSKVYIDFGPHPGMDRLPREAALAGCVVVTNREGAANYDGDVPLPLAFKFSKFTVDSIYNMLKNCCGEKHGEYVEKMKPYRVWILGQEKKMEVCVDRLMQSLRNR